jgi:hypothetical protein
VSKSSGEKEDHLILPCDMARKLGPLVFGLSEVLWVKPKTVVHFSACWKGQFERPQSGEIWKVFPFCIIWYIWREEHEEF